MFKPVLSNVGAFFLGCVCTTLWQSLGSFWPVDHLTTIVPLETHITEKNMDNLDVNMSSSQNNVSNLSLHVSDFSWMKINGTWTLLINNTLFNSTFTRKTILERLAGRKFIFVGDSLTRYQYVNLAYFLVKGSWKSPKPTNENEHEWKYRANYSEAWSRFYSAVPQRLTSPTTYELCDCARDEQGSIENRYFRDTQYNISIDYFYHQTTGPSDAWFQGHYYKYIKAKDGCDQGKGECVQGLCNPGECWFRPDKGWNIRRNITAFTRFVLQTNKYDTLLFADKIGTPYSRHVYGEIARSAKAVGIKTLIWKRRPVRIRPDSPWCDAAIPHSSLLHNYTQAGWTLYNVRPALCELVKTYKAPASDVGWDSNHFHQATNTALNYMLLFVPGFLS